MALEVITEVGKPGRHGICCSGNYQSQTRLCHFQKCRPLQRSNSRDINDDGVCVERERRHFEDHNHSWSKTNYVPRGRRFIHHGHCHHDDTQWKPHAMALDPQYTVNGPDWQSLLRFIPSPHDDNKKNEELWPDKSSHLRTYPGSSACTVFEWSYYTNGYDTGKKCFFDRNHLRSAYGADEITDVSRMGARRKKNNIDSRNGLWTASPGDKSYKVPEYSSDFHKFGSTRPVVNFSGSPIKKPDTFVPLIPLPPVPCEPYVSKERRRRKQQECQEVLELEEWTPAQPLHQTLKDFLQQRK